MGVTTGFSDLDRMLDGGLENEHLYLIAARPAMGKTGFMLNMVEHICFRAYKTALIFSAEATNKVIVERLMSLKSGVDYQKIRLGRLESEDWNRITHVAEEFEQSKLIVDDTQRISTDELKKKCIEYQKQNPELAVIFVDYIQLIKRNGVPESRRKEIASILEELKSVAQELHVPVVAISQLSREPENRKDHRPRMSDLSILADVDGSVDAVMFLYRDDYYNMDSEKKGIAEIILAQNPFGNRGTCELVFISGYIKFVNIERNYGGFGQGCLV